MEIVLRISPESRAAFGTFMKKLKKFVGSSATASEQELKSLLKTADSGVSVADRAIRDLPVTSKNGGLLVNGHTMGEFDKVLRRADLKELMALSGKSVPITAAEEKAFATIIGKTPERAVKDVESLAAVAKRNNPHLDAKVEDLPHLSENAKADVKKIENKLFKYFKQGAIIGLTIGAIYVTIDWLTKATEARKGCYMLTTIDGQTTSCKIMEYSCEGRLGEGTKECGNLPYYNVTLVAIVIAERSNSDATKKAMASAIAEPVDTIRENIDKIITDKFDLLTTFVQSIADKLPTFAKCSVSNSSIEGGKIPACRMCSPSAAVNSTEYIDSSQYADNITFQCVTDPSILDTVSDVITSTGRNLLGNVGDVIFSGGFGKYLKYGLIAAVAIVLIVIVMRIISIIPKKNNNDSK
jgi:hypothetical protein